MKTSLVDRVIITDWDENFVSIGYIHGVEYIEGDEGWFTSLVLYTMDGQRLEGWKHMIRPLPLLLEYNGDGNNTA